MEQTRVTVKTINNTSHTFKIANSSLPISQEERESFVLEPNRSTFAMEFDYNYGYPWPNNRSLFNEFIDFVDQNAGFRLELALTMTTSFGVLTPTLKPNIKNKVTSNGQSAIRCSTRLTKTSDKAPYSFAIEINLG